MELRVKKLKKGAVIPKYATDGSACFDLTAVEIFQTRDQIKYDTGLGFEIPKGYVGLIFPRSSIVNTSLRLGNCVGVIDSDYRGPVSFVFDTIDVKGPFYEAGDRVGQMMIIPVNQVEFKEVEELSSTERGTGGFGSTGK